MRAAGVWGVTGPSPGVGAPARTCSLLSHGPFRQLASSAPTHAPAGLLTRRRSLSKMAPGTKVADAPDPALPAPRQRARRPPWLGAVGPVAGPPTCPRAPPLECPPRPQQPLGRVSPEEAGIVFTALLPDVPCGGAFDRQAYTDVLLAAANATGPSQPPSIQLMVVMPGLYPTLAESLAGARAGSAGAPQPCTLADTIAKCGERPGRRAPLAGSSYVSMAPLREVEHPQQALTAPAGTSAPAAGTVVFTRVDFDHWWEDAPSAACLFRSFFSETWTEATGTLAVQPAAPSWLQAAYGAGASVSGLRKAQPLSAAQQAPPPPSPQQVPPRVPGRPQ